MDGEVTLAHITEAHAARKSASEQYSKDQENEERKEFHFIRNAMQPILYDADLERLRRRRNAEGGLCLQENQNFLKWRDQFPPAGKILWLTGIPGAVWLYLSSL